MQSALANNSDRIQASIAVFTDESFKLKASTVEKADHFVAAVQRYARQTQSGGAQQYQVEVIDGQPYQIVAVPVRAPAVIGWVGMGFRIDRQLLQDMSSLSGLEVALMLRHTDGDWAVSVGTMDASQWSMVAHGWEQPITSEDAPA